MGSIAQGADNPPITINVWPSDAPGEKPGEVGEETAVTSPKDKVTRVSNVSVPQLIIHRPPSETSKKIAVLILPGGGYERLAFNKEGTWVTDWLVSKGITGAVLKYRVPRRKGLPKHLAPLQDAQRAMRMLRAKADELGIDPENIGVLGFSAGGHLTGMLSTNYDKNAYEPMDEMDRLSCRPAFSVLLYPAYMEENGALNPEFRVNKKTPPALLFHANDDSHTSLSSVLYFSALKKAGVPGELHVYAKGGHGFGMTKSEHPATDWPNVAEAWFREMKIVAP